MVNKKNKGIGLNSNTVAGALSIFVLAVILILKGIVFLISMGQSFGLTDIVFLIVFSYIAYKTLIKKEKLTKWEWAAFIIFFIISFFAFLVGLIAGIFGGI